MITYKEFASESLTRVKEIFEAEGWRAYLNDDAKLKRAFGMKKLEAGDMVSYFR